MMDIEINQEKMEEIWEELKKEMEEESPLPHEKTATQWANEVGMPRRKAKYILNKKVSLGKYKKRKIHNVDYYSPIAE